MSQLDDILGRTIKRANDLDEFGNAKDAENLYLFKESKADIKTLILNLLAAELGVLSPEYKHLSQKVEEL